MAGTQRQKAAAAAAAAAGAAVAAGAATVARRRGREPRTYRLRGGKPLTDEVRRVARGRIDHALDELRGKSDRTAEQAVHEARKDMKKLRALLRLVRGELGDELYRAENARFRDTARLLSGVRDADVMLATLDSLDAGAPPELREALEAHRRSLEVAGTPREEAVAELEDARLQVERWPLEREGFDAIEPGLRRMYRRGLRALDGVQQDSSDEALHEWRKRLKDLWYHLTLLEDAWPRPMEAMADEAHELSDRLGEDHDLVVLQQWARDHAAALDLSRLGEAVAARRAALQADAMTIGRRLYAERPRAFARRVGGWWAAAS
jgi:CHAD domain-containing protein